MRAECVDLNPEDGIKIKRAVERRWRFILIDWYPAVSEACWSYLSSLNKEYSMYIKA